MKKNVNNFLKVTVRKVKVPCEVGSFTIKMEIFGHVEETDKISTKEMDLNKVSYF